MGKSTTICHALCRQKAPKEIKLARLVQILKLVLVLAGITLMLYNGSAEKQRLLTRIA